MSSTSHSGAIFSIRTLPIWLTTTKRVGLRWGGGRGRNIPRITAWNHIPGPCHVAWGMWCRQGSRQKNNARNISNWKDRGSGRRAGTRELRARPACLFSRYKFHLICVPCSFGRSLRMHSPNGRRRTHRMESGCRRAAAAAAASIQSTKLPCTDSIPICGPDVL